MNHLNKMHERFLRSRQAFDPGAKSWYRMEKKEDRAEVFIYDGIGMFGVEAESFIAQINALEVKNIDLRINSPGGNVFDGTAIYNALRRHKAQVNVKIDGLAASMASIIALAGDTVEMADNAFYMIHMPFSLVVGNSDDMRKEADVLDKLADQAVSTYANNSSLSEEEARAAMREETWYTAEEAKEVGFIDSIYDGESEEMRFDLSVFAKAPDGISSSSEQSLTARELEMALRDLGASRKQACEVASIYSQGQRDSVPSQRDAADFSRALDGLKALNQSPIQR